MLLLVVAIFQDNNLSFQITCAWWTCLKVWHNCIQCKQTLRTRNATHAQRYARATLHAQPTECHLFGAKNKEDSYWVSMVTYIVHVHVPTLWHCTNIMTSTNWTSWRCKFDIPISTTTLIFFPPFHQAIYLVSSRRLDAFKIIINAIWGKKWSNFQDGCNESLIK